MTLWDQLSANPWLAAYAAGFISGVMFQRRVIRWALGGRP